MIAIVSPTPRERGAFIALCASRGWRAVECDSVRRFKRLLARVSLRAVLTRHRLADGYSDDVIAALTSADTKETIKVIVLIDAGSTSSVEARQVALGADCVQRDPVRTDVLLEYLGRYIHSPSGATRATGDSAGKAVPFAGGILNCVERTLRHGDKIAEVTPREVALARLLVEAAGEVVSYEVLYADILDRPFTADTSNMRVLLGKLSASASRVDIALRQWVEVIPKAGYRYQAKSAGNEPA